MIRSFVYGDNANRIGSDNIPFWFLPRLISYFSLGLSVFFFSFVKEIIIILIMQINSVRLSLSGSRNARKRPVQHAFNPVLSLTSNFGFSHTLM